MRVFVCVCLFCLFFFFFHNATYSIECLRNIIPEMHVSTWPLGSFIQNLVEFGSEEALWALLNTQQIESLSCLRVLQEQSSVKYLMGKKLMSWRSLTIRSYLLCGQRGFVFRNGMPLDDTKSQALFVQRWWSFLKEHGISERYWLEQNDSVSSYFCTFSSPISPQMVIYVQVT